MVNIEKYCKSIKQSDLDSVNANVDKAIKQTNSLQATVSKAVDYVKNITGDKDKVAQERANKLKGLGEKLNTAINVYETAPDDLESAERNFYVFKEGEDGYKDLRLRRYKISADKIKARSIKAHNEFMRELSTLNKDYTAETIYTKRMTELLKKLNDENRELKNQIDGIRGKSATSDRKTWYEDQQMDKIKKYTPILRFLYFTLLVVYIIFGGYIVREEYKDWKIWLIIIAYTVFPFTLYWFIVQIFALYQSMMYKKVPKDVYLNLAKPDTAHV
jgi:hypothetical protein